MFYPIGLNGTEKAARNLGAPLCTLLRTVASIAASLLPSIAFMLFIERALKAEVVALVGC